MAGTRAGALLPLTGIQGRASRFVARVDGSYPNVVGLPTAQVAKHLAKYLQPAS